MVVSRSLILGKRMSRIDEKEVMKDFERMQVDEVRRHRKRFKEIERDL